MSESSLTDWLKELDLFGKNQGKEPFVLETVLEHLRHLLPNQGPIKDFIHHNPLHGFQKLSFHEGVGLASSLFGSKRYLNLAFYEDLFKKGSLSESHLDFAINSLGGAEQKKNIKSQLLNFTGTREERSPPVSQWGLRSYWKQNHHLDLSEQTAPTVFRILSHYLDQGISFWPFPSRKDSFWLSLKELDDKSFFSIIPFKKAELKKLLALSSEEALRHCLEHLVGDPLLFSRYLLETLLSYPGWSGMVCALETNPSSLRKPCTISLLDFLAFTLSVELLNLKQLLGNDFAHPNYESFLESQSPISNSESTFKAPFWQEAYEWAFYEQLLGSVFYQAKQPETNLPRPWAQAIFCIDDRECSLRRHLELLDPGIGTFGTAGFFGIDFWFLAHDELYPMQQSPITLTPKHVVRSTPKIRAPKTQVKNTVFDSVLSGLFKDLFLVPFLSVSALKQFVQSLFLQKGGSATSSSLTQFESQVMLEFLSDGSKSQEAHFKTGFTIEEMTERVARTLRGMGLTKDFADSIYVIAHGASSSNNPHFAAYDCGACSGKSGAPNARAFAWMANYPPVRDSLKSIGIDIPSTTTFFAALHDTTQDRAIFFEEDLENKVLPEAHRKFKLLFRKALDRNAKERSRRFELISPDTSPVRAAEFMAHRAHSIFEPRPELNHATNAATVVGRRHLTRGLFLDRRSFLQSYDPFTDPNGAILEGLLGAVIPVCGGINLEYYFSRMDNEVYGAGTKLSHNVVGLMAVSNGVNNDLIPGLPLQMIEAHDPLRLLILIDQEPEIISSVLKKNPFLFEWVNNHWIRLAALSPTSHNLFLWAKDGWQPLQTDSIPTPPKINVNPMELAQSQENLPLGIVDSSLTGVQL